MKNPWFLAAAILLGLSSVAWAQQVPGGVPSPEDSSRPKLPDGPLLGKAPPFSEWTITFTYVSDAARKALPETPTRPRLAYLDLRPAKVTTTRTGDIVHESITDQRGRQSESWTEAGTSYYKNAGDTQWMQSVQLTASKDPSSSGALPLSGFRDLDWISADTYAGTIPYGKSTCFVFVPNGSRKLDLRDPAKQAKLLEGQSKIAYVDAESRMPVAERNGDVVRIFRFNSPPAAMQTLPSDLTKAINDGKEARRRLEQPAARPY